MKINSTLNPAVSTSLAKTKNNTSNFTSMVNSIIKSSQNSDISPYSTAQNELASWNKTMLKFEIQSELNKLFFASYGIGDKKRNDPFIQAQKLNELSKKLKQL